MHCSFLEENAISLEMVKSDLVVIGKRGTGGRVIEFLMNPQLRCMDCGF